MTYRLCLDCYCDDEITDSTLVCPHCGGTYIVTPDKKDEESE